MFCSNCGKQIDETVKICPECGHDLQAGSKKAGEIIQESKKETQNTNIKEMKRTAEFVLGLIGGILGLFGAMSAMLLGGIVDAFSKSDSGLGSLGILALVFSVIGIIGSIMVKKKGKLGGFLMLIAAVGGFISVFMAYIISGILLLLGGIISLRKPDQNPDKVKWKIWIPVGLICSILLFVVALTVPANGDTSTEKTNAKSEFGMKEEVHVGDLIFVVNSTASSNIFTDKYSVEHKTDGTFLAVNVEVTNAGKEAITIDSSMFKIIENDGTTYDPSTDLNDLDLFLDSLNPKTKKVYSIMFELPQSNGDYTFQVSDGMFSNQIENIKLTFKSENESKIDSQNMTYKDTGNTIKENVNNKNSSASTDETKESLVVSATEASNRLKLKYPECTINYYPEEDVENYGNKYFYYFEIVDGTSPAFSLYVCKEDGEIYYNVDIEGIELKPEKDIVKKSTPMPSSRKERLTTEELLACGIGLTKEKLIEMLGQPQSITEEEGEDYDYTYDYGYAKYTIFNSLVEDIHVSQESNFSGPRNLKIGDNLETVLSCYPIENANFNTENRGYLYGTDVFSEKQTACLYDKELIITTNGWDYYFIKIYFDDNKVVSYDIYHSGI